MKFSTGVLCLLFSFTVSTTTSASEKPDIIFMIGDGMGPAYTSAYRYYQDNPNTAEIETTIFDELFVGKISTHPEDQKYIITDSAAAATALATGVKTFNGGIAVDKSQGKLKTLLEMAKEHDFQTAMVVTSSIVHATPASFAAHVNHRNKYNEIADQYIDNRINEKPRIDLLLGGGQKFFIRKDRNIIAEYAKQGYETAINWDGFKNLKSLPAIALLADDGMSYAIESDDKTRLKTMTSKALSLLRNSKPGGDKPFFLLIEASQIDWCGHANDIACVMAEMYDFSEAIKVVKKFIDQNPNTILVITADHETGGLSIGANIGVLSNKHGKYLWLPEVIKRIKKLSSSIVRRLVEQPEHWQSEWNTLTGISLSDEEKHQFEKFIKAVNIPDNRTNQLLVSLHALTIGAINQRSRTGWAGAGHTGIDVEVFSYGKYASEFVGHMDNTDIAKKLAKHIH